MAATVLRPVEQSSEPPAEDSAEADAGAVSAVANKEAAQPKGSGGVPPSDTYRIAVEEYRFQSLFNWSRTQYLLAFNAAVLIAATGLFVPSGAISALIFGLGAIAALASIQVVKTQHDYYRAARNRLRRVEEVLEIPDNLRLDTTQGLGGKKRRSWSVNLVIQLLLWAIVAANAFGFIKALFAL